MSYKVVEEMEFKGFRLGQKVRIRKTGKEETVVGFDVEYDAEYAKFFVIATTSSSPRANSFLTNGREGVCSATHVLLGHEDKKYAWYSTDEIKCVEETNKSKYKNILENLYKFSSDKWTIKDTLEYNVKPVNHVSTQSVEYARTYFNSFVALSAIAKRDVSRQAKINAEMGVVYDLDKLVNEQLDWMFDCVMQRVIYLLNISLDNDEVVGLIIDCVKDGGYDKVIDELVKLKVIEIIEENK